MEDEYILIENQLPDKGIDIIGIDNVDNIYYCFRCNCKNSKCVEWRCSVSGFGLDINIIKWKHIKT